MNNRTYDPRLPAKCLRDFLYGGVQFKEGRAFPHERLKPDDVALRGLWLANYIEFVVVPQKSTDARHQA